MDVICQEFHCDPERALAQNPALVFGVLEARLAKAAKAQHNEDVTKLTPAMVKIWTEMVMS